LPALNQANQAVTTEDSEKMIEGYKHISDAGNQTHEKTADSKYEKLYIYRALANV
jgi:hypothetical protein